MSEPPSRMDTSEDSGCITASFEDTHIFESTPTNPWRATGAPKVKRKSVGPVPNFCDSSPEFCSTLNDSLVFGLQKCSLELTFEEECGENSPKYIKTNEGKAIAAPMTPVKVPPVSDSPYKEAIEILYPHKPVIEPRKPTTPLKYVQRFTPVKANFATTTADPMRVFRGKSLVLRKIFSYLSPGDLYRVSMVSKTWRASLMEDSRTYARYLEFLMSHRTNKENYTYTPPESPMSSPESPPVSPGSRNFHKFVKLGKELKPDQQLCKCQMCSSPAVVQKSIAQCQSLSCGYIYCLKCPSYSKTGPEDFHDRCRSGQLLLSGKAGDSPRPQLSNLSNSLNCSYETSGFVSESSSPIGRVKKCLNFSRNILSESNVSVVVKRKRRRMKPRIVPVVDGERREEATPEIESPPKVTVGRNQSRKNLKRLLF